MASIDFIYQNEYQKEISFPLGGIGSGCVGLSGDGRLIDCIKTRNNEHFQKNQSFASFT